MHPRRGGRTSEPRSDPQPPLVAPQQQLFDQLQRPEQDLDLLELRRSWRPAHPQQGARSQGHQPPTGEHFSCNSHFLSPNTNLDHGSPLQPLDSVGSSPALSPPQEKHLNAATKERAAVSGSCWTLAGQKVAGPGIASSSSSSSSSTTSSWRAGGGSG